MWETEEYATSTFISVILEHIIATPDIAQQLILKIKRLKKLDGVAIINKRNPKVPIFNKIAAKIIDPNTGASTWALGSHMCTKNIGVLTKKAKDNIKVIQTLV